MRPTQSSAKAKAFSSLSSNLLNGTSNGRWLLRVSSPARNGSPVPLCAITRSANQSHITASSYPQSEGGVSNRRSLCQTSCCQPVAYM